MLLRVRSWNDKVEHFSHALYQCHGDDEKPNATEFEKRCNKLQFTSKLFNLRCSEQHTLPTQFVNVEVVVSRLWHSTSDQRCCGVPSRYFVLFPHHAQTSYRAPFMLCKCRVLSG